MRISTKCLLVWKKANAGRKVREIGLFNIKRSHLLAFEIQLETNSNKVTWTERANSNENSYTCLTKRGYFLGENKVNTKWWTRRLIIPQVRAFFWEWSSGKPVHIITIQQGNNKHGLYTSCVFSELFVTDGTRSPSHDKNQRIQDTTRIP